MKTLILSLVLLVGCTTPPPSDNEPKPFPLTVTNMLICVQESGHIFYYKWRGADSLEESKKNYLLWQLTIAAQVELEYMRENGATEETVKEMYQLLISQGLLEDRPTL